MEDELLVTKTLLLCYPHLDDLFDALTESVENCVRNGFYAIFTAEQMALYERIARYEDRKVGLCNMKYLVGECFRSGRGISLSLLKERYILGKSMNELMEKYGVCMRTCYRYLKKGLADFTLELERLGFDKKRILTECGDEPLFQTMLTRVIREDDVESRREAKGAQEGGINNRHTPLHLDSNGRGHCCV